MIDPQKPYQGSYGNYYTPVTGAQGHATLMQRVSYLLCTALLVTAGCAYAGRDLSPTLGLPLAVGAIACVFALSMSRSNTTLGLVLLYALSAVEGLMFGPLIARIVHGYPFGGVIVAEATALSGIIIAGLGSYVWISNKDFGYLGKMLFWGLLAIIVIGFLSLFLHSLAAMGGFQLLISLATVGIFVGYVLYDFSNIKFRYGPNDFVIATVALYLDFLNLFMAILRILMILTSGQSDRRR